MLPKISIKMSNSHFWHLLILTSTYKKTIETPKQLKVTSSTAVIFSAIEELLMIHDLLCNIQIFTNGAKYWA